MIDVSENGLFAMTAAITDLAHTLHLITGTGELQAEGYAPVTLLRDAWANGMYPTQKWVVTSETEQRLLRYQIRQTNGRIYYGEAFPSPIVLPAGVPKKVSVSLQVLLFQRRAA